MMFSTEVNVSEVAKKQYHYKLNSSLGLFWSMLFVQVLALLLSLGGVGGLGSTSGGNITLSAKNYSGDIIIVFTIVWISVVSYILTSKEYRNIDFAFVSNRLTSNLANAGLLLTGALAGGLTAVLGGVLLRVIVYFSLGSASILRHNFFVTPMELLTSFTVTVLYLVLVSAIVYHFGMLAQLSKMFLVVLPVSLFLIARSDLIHILLSAIYFFVRESSLPILAIKVIFMVALLFGSTLILSNRLEVR